MKNLALLAMLLCLGPGASAQDTDIVSTTTLLNFEQAAAKLTEDISARAEAKKLAPQKADMAFQKGAQELIKQYFGEGTSLSILPMQYPEQAVKLFSGEITVAPTLPDAYASRAQAYGRLSRHADALADYDRLLALDPNHANGRSRKMRGTMNMFLGRTDAAIEDFSKAVELTPDNTFLYLERARAYIAAADFDSAADDMSSFFRLADDDDMQTVSAGQECAVLTARNYEIPGCAAAEESTEDAVEDPTQKPAGKEHRAKRP